MNSDTPSVYVVYVYVQYRLKVFTHYDAVNLLAEVFCREFTAVGQIP